MPVPVHTTSSALSAEARETPRAVCPLKCTLPARHQESLHAAQQHHTVTMTDPALFTPAPAPRVLPGLSAARRSQATASAQRSSQTEKPQSHHGTEPFERHRSPLPPHLDVVRGHRAVYDLGHPVCGTGEHGKVSVRVIAVCDATQRRAALDHTFASRRLFREGKISSFQKIEKKFCPLFFFEILSKGTNVYGKST